MLGTGEDEMPAIRGFALVVIHIFITAGHD